MPEISIADAAPGERSSRLDPRTKLLALLVLNAVVMRTGPVTTLLAVQALTVGITRKATARASTKMPGRCTDRSAAFIWPICIVRYT